MLRKLFIFLGNLIAILGSLGVLYLLLTKKEIAHAGWYTFLAMMAILLGLLIRYAAIKIKLKKPQRRKHQSWIINEKNNE